MSETKKTLSMLEVAQRQSIKPGSPEMEQHLMSGYGISIEEARHIVADYEKDHKSWPFEEVRKAKAMLAAFTARPVAIDTSPAWVREPGPA